MCVGYMQVLHHFTQGTWVLVDFRSGRGSWKQSPVSTEGRLYCNVVCVNKFLHF